MTTAASADRTDDFFKKLSVSQLKTMATIKKLGAEKNMSYSLISISVEESQLCKVKLNIQSGAVGCYHNLVSSVMPRTNREDTPYIRNVIAVKLYENIGYASKHAMLELDYWKKRRSGWKNIWASYYGGKYYRGKDSVAYSKRIAKGIRYIREIEKKCGPLEGIVDTYCVQEGKLRWATVRQLQSVSYLDKNDLN